MRLRGYTENEAVWDHGCEVLFDEVDYGTNVLLCKFEFTPAKVRKKEQVIPGVSGALDYSEALCGYPEYENMKCYMQLGIRRPAEFAAFQPPFGTDERRFLTAINGKRVKMRFKNSNFFYIMGRPEIRSYTRNGLVWLIDIDISADPFWYEDGMSAAEWQIENGAQNLFDGANTPVWQTDGNDVTCTWQALRNGYVLHAPVNASATVRITGLDATHSYSLSLRVIQGPGTFLVFGEGGLRRTDLSNITGTTEIQIMMVSKVPKYVATVFTDISLIDNSDGTSPIELNTLDMPMNELHFFSSAPCVFMMGEERIDIQAGETTIYGLNIQPNTTVKGYIAADMPCYGYMMFQRGCFTCTG